MNTQKCVSSLIMMIVCYFCSFLAIIGSGSCTGDGIEGGDGYYGYACAYLEGEQLYSIKLNTLSHALSYVCQNCTPFIQKAPWVTEVVMSMLRVTRSRIPMSSTLETMHASVKPHARMLVSTCLLYLFKKVECFINFITIDK